MLEENEAEKTIGFFCHIFVIGGILLGGGGGGSRGRNPGSAYVLGTFVLEMRKLLAISKAEFYSSVGAGQGH